MYVDQHPSAHRRFAAYDALEDYLNSPYYQQELEERRQAAAFERQVNEENNAYRNRALAQQGSASRLAASTSRQNAQLAASTQLKTQKMQIDATYRMFKEKMDALDIPSLQLDAWYKNAQIGLARANLALEARGPRNALQYSAAMGQINPGNNYLPASLAALARNAPTGYNAPSGTPEAISFNSLAQQYGLGNQPGGGGGTDTSGQDAQREDAVRSMIKDVASRGPGGIAPGVYESLSDYDKEIFKSGLEDAGYNADDWLQRRQMAGIGQGDYRAA